LLHLLPRLALEKLRRRQHGASSPELEFTAPAADAFLAFGASRQSRGVLRWARRQGARSALLLQSDADTAPPVGVNDFGEPGEVRAEAIDCADVIVVQNEQQRAQLRENFGREGALLVNPVELPESLADAPSPPGWPRRCILWVGRAERFHKRPELMLVAAAQAPELPVVMVLNPGDARFEAELRRTRPPHVTLLQSIPFADMPRLFRTAAVLASTGSPQYEGLPNVFLQAAAAGVPVVSLEHAPQPFASSGGLVLAGDMDTFVSELRRLWEQPEEARGLGELGREWVSRHCSLEAYCESLLRLLTPSR
jgi:glycosyltransferase involved in cell wall biosynthesis